MARKIQHKRGLEANLPQLDVAEIAFTTDSKKPFIGSADGNVEIAKKADVDEKASKTELTNAVSPKADKTYVDTELGKKASTDEVSAVSAQLADIAINVKSFGAKGDGVADDLGAINNAISEAIGNGGGVIYFPEGEYLVNGTIDIQGGNLTFIGTGRSSTIKAATDVRVFQALGHDFLTFHRLRIVGQRSSDTQLGNGHGIYVGNANRIHVSECHFEDLSGKGVFFTGFHGLSASDNLPQGVWDSHILDNYMSRCSEGAMVYNDCHRVEVARNTILKAANVGIFIDDSHRVDGTEIARTCTAINVEGNRVEKGLGTGITLAGIKNSAVRDNYIMNGGQVGGVQPNVDGIVLQTAQNHIVCEHNIIEGNTIVFNTNRAINLIASSNNVIRGNTLINNSYKRSSGGSSHIQLASLTIKDVVFGSNRNIIEGNYSHVDSTDSTMGTHVYITDATSENNIVRSNHFLGGASVNHVLNNGTNTVIGENTKDGELVDVGFKDGTASTPSIGFSSDPTSGFYKITNGEMMFVSSGSPVFRLRSTGATLSEGKDFSFGVNTGSRIGTAPTQKIGFWGAPPVTRPTGLPAAATDLDTALTLVNYLRAELLRMGLVYQ